MRLNQLREELKRELSSSRAQRHFDKARQDRSELRLYSSVFAMLPVLESREEVGHEAQDRLLRVLLAEAQAHPEQRLWRQVLLYAFLPSLIRIRRGVIQGEHEPQELDACLWAAFLGLVHGYPLHRQGSIAANLVRDTRKAYMRVLIAEQKIREHQRTLVDYARRVSENDTKCFNLAEHQEPAQFVLEPDEREEIIRVLQRCEGISPEDGDLLIAVDVDGMTIPMYMQTRGLMTGDKEADARERDRLARRRLRARERLRLVFRESLRR